MKIVVNKQLPPYGVLLTAHHARKAGCSVSLEWSNAATSVAVSDDLSIDSAATICLHVARELCADQLYGSGSLQRAAVDHWLSYSTRLAACSQQKLLSDELTALDDTLLPLSFLAGEAVTVADYAVWGALFTHRLYQNALKTGSVPPNMRRWYQLIADQEVTKEMIASLPAEVKKVGSSPTASAMATHRKEEGKFVDLPGAEMGKIVVRFPPEASGYLHIGHAKAALLNQYYQHAFQGQLIMRFDDTNPQKENAEFEREILADLKLLEIQPDRFTHSSDHFDTMLDKCEILLKQGKAYVDDTNPEQMKTEREQLVESKNRDNLPEKNLAMWKEMVLGSEQGQRCCVRAKIDMKSPNGCMRDPTIYRCKPEPHVRTGLKYKVYPTYDFCCPIVDSIEGVTHALRTTEYHDRDVQYFWFIDALALRKPYIYEYSRLNMTNTVLSKRKLAWFVENGLVDGWDDPRFPTVRGILRRGMTVEGLKQFIIAQGSSRSVVFMEWDKIWAFNKKVIDPIAPRYTTVVKDKCVTVSVRGVSEAKISAPKHPKNPEIGMKTVWSGPKILIDRIDVELLVEGQNATFINWGNLRIDKINRNSDGHVSIDVTPQLENKDFKKTVKLTWLAENAQAEFIPTVCVYYDHIISKAVLAKDEDFKQFIPENTRHEVFMLGDPELAGVKKSDIIQIQRRGFFICDSPYLRGSVHSFCDSPCVLVYIPDGHSKNPFPMSVNSSANKSGAQVVCVSAITSYVGTLYGKVADQGEKVRQMKSQKQPKTDIDKQVKVLLELKTQYKTASGMDWKPGSSSVAASTGPAPSSQTDSCSGARAINESIAKQGDKIRQLKAAKADKALVDIEVKALLKLKAEFKSETGVDWKQDVKIPGGHADAGVLPDQLSAQIAEQGDVVRKSKADKADKAAVNAEVQKLLALKAMYKSATGRDWKPSETIPVASTSAIDLNRQILDLGNTIRQLKANKAEKSQIDAEVKKLIILKASFKSASGQDWKPDLQLSPSLQQTSSSVPSQLDQTIVDQGNKIRQLKSGKAQKSVIDPEVQKLLSLKAEFKSATGKDWKPGMALPDEKSGDGLSTPSADTPSGEGSELLAKIEAQGGAVRELKTNKADKSAVDSAVQVLLKLKQDYKSMTGQDPPGGRPAKQPQDKKASSAKKKPAPQPKLAAATTSDDSNMKKQTRLGMEARKEENLADWYSQIITKAEMIEYYDVSGCYILRPWAFAIWDMIKDFFDAEIKKMGVENCYFPMFVSKAALEKEKTHIADFSPEVAWVTKSGDSDLAEPIAIRPTSETVMYPTYAKWIQSHRDLPLRLNQWNSVVRWEFKHPQPFLRTREFLWQEGHTAFATKAEADEEVLQILELYRRIYEELMAIPVVPGRKTEKEKFAGGDYTTTVEAYIAASGRAIQGGTSHHLGQNFSRMFDIGFEHPETQQRTLVFQNSWGLTTRTLGVLVMVHGDNQGLVLPPRIASIQVVLVPCGITASLSDADREGLLAACGELEARLKTSGVRCRADLRLNYSPGWKFNHWELKGVPVRLELGPRDRQRGQLVLVRRDSGAKSTHAQSQLETAVRQTLDCVQTDMLQRARDGLAERMVVCHDFNTLCTSLEAKCLIQAPFCGLISCEDNIKKDSARDEVAEPGAPAMGAKGLCIPFKQPKRLDSGTLCVHPACKRPATCYTLFGRSY